MGDQLERLGSEAAGLESTVKDELCMDIDPPFRENVATAEDWRKALNKVVPAVVVLRTTACRAFDTEAAGASYATGFVVDKRRGIILTNRHVVKPGIFSNFLIKVQLRFEFSFFKCRNGVVLMIQCFRVCDLKVFEFKNRRLY